MTANESREENITLTFDATQAGERLDTALAALLPDRSRAFIKKLLDRNHITLDGRPVKPSLKLKGTETIHVHIPEPEPLTAKAEDLPLNVLYEDNDVIVINKQPGMVAHPSQGHRDGTLVNALLHHYGDSLSGIGGVLRPGIVHRLDKDTTGCLCAAKNDNAHKKLIQQFMERDVEKLYLAITDRPPKPVSGKVEGNIGRSTRDRKLHAMLKTGGRHSLTYYETLENYGPLALVRCRLMTGRTHQARVHLATLGSPVLCDRDYGRQDCFTRRELDNALHLFRHGADDPSKRGQGGAILLNRQALHAAELSFHHPVTGERLHFSAPIPPDMLSVLTPLREAKKTMEKK